MGRPRWLYQRGRLRWVLGRQAAATRDWRRAQLEAQRYALPFEQELIKQARESV